MAKVYSYARLSTEAQLKGDGQRRQEELLTKWLKSNPEHEIATEMVDYGISSFRGKNLNKDYGAMGKFIALCEEGQIEKGSILLLEMLDRFSRLPPSKSYTALCRLVNDYGITIITLSPSEKILDSSNIDDIENAIMTICYFLVANNESQKKSERVRSYWQQKRKDTYKGKKIGQIVPDYLVYDEKTESFNIKPEAHKMIKHVFEMANNGYGRVQITHECTRLFKPFTRSGRFNQSYINKLLGDRSLIGEFQNYTTDENGKRIKDGEPVKDYFPHLIDDDLFYSVQVAKVARRKIRGQHSDFVYLFSGLIYTEDECKAHIQTSRKKNKDGTTYTQRRYYSSGSRSGIKGSTTTAFNYYAVEAYVLAALDELDSTTFERQADVNRLLVDLDETKKKIEAIRMELVDSSALKIGILSNQLELSLKRQEEIEAELASITNTNTASNEIKPILERLLTVDKEKEHDFRIALKTKIAQIIERIDLVVEKDSSRRLYADILIKLKNGELKILANIPSSGFEKELRNRPLNLFDN